ncbi:MAG: hypothetical protein HY826_14960 [Actinobacteria bacterium]|nr:hypothetical protein [Actinomycetota bacterium]
MNKGLKYTISVTSITLASALGLGAVASAAGSASTSGARQISELTTEQKCEKQAEIVARATAAQERIAAQVAKLTEKRAAAEAAGETEKVARIDKRLERLAKLSDRIAARLAKFQAWAAENCTV